ncbi:hypothetical protein TNCV_1846891 [Trichonephila clavipes]|nr:hypothetical protein TNCV_1846891 [Trichonephila clavipes]
MTKPLVYFLLTLPCDSQFNICLSRLASGHLKSPTYPAGNRMFSICPECQLEQASSQHFLDCHELDWEDIHDSPLLVSDFVKVKGFTNLV